ncbi:MAG: NAD(P)/FAD-dependent oxidoreductase [Patescibacteria group bacterium]|nr:NAD(P)/FAD-dependent oxidoreductase [Patescibacteria group bacterium]
MSYDVIVIGGGIGGLMAGCYLAKAGRKVLLLEKEKNIGGCCVSFTRKNFNFDAGAHSLGTFRASGVMRNIFEELGLFDLVQLKKPKTTDQIVASDFEFKLPTDTQQALISLIRTFPKEEASLCKFFELFLIDKYLALRGAIKAKVQSFSELLDTYFNDEKLKAIFEVFTANLGMPPNNVSALVAVLLLKEYIFDGGYCVLGGMQNFVNAVARIYETKGGVLINSCEVDEIMMKDNAAVGVLTKCGKTFKSKYVISSADAHHTFSDLVKKNCKEKSTSKRLVPSESGFVVYLGLKKHVSRQFNSLNVWMTKSLDRKSLFNSWSYDGLVNLNLLLCTMPTIADNTLCASDNDVIRILAPAKYASPNKWRLIKKNVCSDILEIVSKKIPGIHDIIDVLELATPATFFEYTYNRCGALFGLAATPVQCARNVFPQKTSIDGLYLSGHWATTGVGQSGISVVSMSGRNIANIILKKDGK